MQTSDSGQRKQTDGEQSRWGFPKTLYVPYPVQGHEETRASEILLSRRRWHVGDGMGKTEAAQHESTRRRGNSVY